MSSKTIIHILLLRNPTLVDSQEVQELLIAHSFDLTAFEENKKRMDKYLKKLERFLAAHCNMPSVLVNLVYEYYDYFDLLIDFFTQT